jgi:DNA polymerase delta subunit 1
MLFKFWIIPSALVDPIIHIGNSVQRFGCSAIERVIFCLLETAEIPRATVLSYATERELIMAWKAFYDATDPDIIIGYNIKSFDFSYMLERAEVLNVRNFARLGRSTQLCRVVTRNLYSSVFGAFYAKDISFDGRPIFDLLHIIRRDHKLRSYSLNAVSFHFLGEQKEDMDHVSMFGLQNGTRETRRRIASYCLQDTLLPLRLMEKLNLLINFTELARATHVPIDYFSSRGAAIKVLAQIYAEAGRSGYLIPDMAVAAGDTSFEGAFVLDPLKGFYEDPIAVLDFSSLYPSIIISKNMCYTTLLSCAQTSELEANRTVIGSSAILKKTANNIKNSNTANLVDNTNQENIVNSNPKVRRYF